MTKCTSARKICVTCDYWTGKRSIYQNGNQVDYSSSEKGKCMGKQKGQNKVVGSNCSGWKKWGPLK